MPGSQPIRFGMKTLLGVLTAAAILFGAIAIWGGWAVVAAVVVAIGCLTFRLAEAKLRAVFTFLVLVGMLVGVHLLLLPAVGSREAGPRTRCMSNLKNIALALHLYHEEYGSFPPAYVPDKNGQPMHSWRTLILPYLERRDIYDAYDFSEPWNGPNNSKLADVAIEIFQCPQDETAHRTPYTNYVAVVGPGTVWPGEKTVSVSEVSFKDGCSNTLLLVEVADSGIHWMEPRDLHVSQMAPTINAKKGQGISSKHPRGVVGVFADGRVTFLSEKISPEVLRALLTIDGGEDVDPYDY